MRSGTRYLSLALLLLAGVAALCWRRAERLEAERDRYRGNTEVLLADLHRIRVDSATMAVDAGTLRLTVEEYRRLRADDAAKIEAMGVRIRTLEAAARHRIEVAGPIDAAVRDTVVVRDTVPLLRQKVEMITPHIRLEGIIEDQHLKGSIRIPVVLHQALWVEYKGCWFWKRVKAVHQTVASDNPYVEISYSEYIEIQRLKRR